MNQQNRIADALLQLDPDDEDQWTLEGLPLVDSVAALTGTKLKRQDLTNVAPEFNRERARVLRDERIAAGHAQSTTDIDDGDGADTQDAGAAPANDVEHGDEAGADLEPEPAKFSAMAMDPKAVMASRSLTELALRELEELHLEANAQKKAIDKTIDDLNFKIQIMSRQLDRMSRTAADPHAANIRAYQETTQRARLKRAEAAQRFIAAGTTPKAVLEQLSTTSPIDRAMARKTQRGTQRPNIPLSPAAKAG